MSGVFIRAAACSYGEALQLISKLAAVGFQENKTQIRLISWLGRSADAFAETGGLVLITLIRRLTVKSKTDFSDFANPKCELI